MPLSTRPLNRSRYDLSRFARPLVHERPRLDGANVERLYLIEAKALLDCSPHTVSLQIQQGAELHDVVGARWGNHPFAEPSAIVGVTLGADLVFEGETKPTSLSIVLADPGRCSLSGEKDRRLRQAGMQLLEALGVCKPLHPGLGVDDPGLLRQVAKLLEHAREQMDGFALAKLGIDIDRFQDEGILTEAERITDTVIESAQGERFCVELERCVDPSQVRYRDPFTETDVMLPVKYARRWKIHVDWLREEIITALGGALRGVRGRHFAEEPVYLGEINIDDQAVAAYFATHMSSDRHYAKVDAALRLQPRSVPGVVLTTSHKPFPYAGTNVVVPIEDVLASTGGKSVIDLGRLGVAYRHGQLAAKGGILVSLKVSQDGYSAVLGLPGKAPWQVMGQARVTVLQRLVEGHAAGTPHVNTKKLMQDTGCTSPGNLFAKTSPWRNYLARVEGTHAWQLNLSAANASMEAAPDVADHALEAITG